MQLRRAGASSMPLELLTDAPLGRGLPGYFSKQPAEVLLRSAAHIECDSLDVVVRIEQERLRDSNLKRRFLALE